MKTLLRCLPLLALAFLAGCGKPAAPKPAAAEGSAPAKPLTKIRFQTDWYPQAEHGGHYQALAKGFYAEAGLDVEILSGGPGPTVPQKMIGGLADIAMGRSDDIMVQVGNGLPFVMVGALMQHDPQALLLHDENPVKTFADLNGKSIMAVPGTNWINFLKVRYKIEFNIVPLNYGLAQFMADKNFIQQCFITNEPYYAAKNGAKPRTLLLDDSGFTPYRIFFTTQKFARENPEAIRAFVAASIRGWDDFLSGDSTPGKKLIAARNEQMTTEFMEFTIGAMKANRLISGDPAKGEQTGLLTRKRLQEQMDTLVELKVMAGPVPMEKFVRFDFLPPALQAKTN
jgi:NitT/TauT family transport system substrate-binding protein